MFRNKIQLALLQFQKGPTVLYTTVIEYYDIIHNLLY